MKSPSPFNFDSHGVNDANGNRIVKITSYDIIADYPEFERLNLLFAAAPTLAEALRECITEDGAYCMKHFKSAGQRLEAINKIAKEALKLLEPKKHCQ